MRRVIVLQTLLAFVLLLGIGQVASAQEARCTELGAACLCSEPFNTGTLVGAAPYWKVDDGGTLKCSAEYEDWAIVRNYGPNIHDSPADALAALPAGHSISKIVRTPTDSDGLNYIGHHMEESDTRFYARTAARYYMYRTANFEYSGDGTCEADKFFSFTDQPVEQGGLAVGGGQGTPHLYSFIGVGAWSGDPYLPIDAFVWGPGVELPEPHSALWRGKWWRIEVIIRNRAGGAAPNGFDIIAYAKNITDDGPEYQMMHLQDGGGAAGDVWWQPSTGLTPLVPNRLIHVNFYRQSSTGVCLGYQAISHYLFAGWETDEGQRIGAAREVEGGGGPLGTIMLEILLGIAPFLLPLCVLFCGVLCLFIVVCSTRRSPYADDTRPPPDDGPPQLWPPDVRSGPDAGHGMPSRHPAADDRDDATVGTAAR